MMRTTLLALLILLTAAGAAGADSNAWLTRLDQALDAAAEGDRYILVDLFAEWCGWCRVLEEQVFTTQEFRDFTREFVLLRVDVDDGAEGSALQARFGAYSLPTTLIMDKNQVKIGTVAGFAPTPAFLRKLSSELAAYKGFLDYYEKMKKSDDLGALYRLSAELHERSDGARAVGVIREILRRTGEDSPKAAWLHYLMADAYRLGGSFEDAVRVLQKARALSAKVEKTRDLAEKIDLLSYQIAQDSHNCEKAKKSLEHFLATHPKSSFRREAEKTLDDLRRGQLGCA